MRILPQSMSDAVRRKLPVGDPLHLGPNQVGPLTVDPVKRAKNDLKLEREIQKEIAAFLTLRGIVFFWQRTDRKTTGTVGWPDFTFAFKSSRFGLNHTFPIGCEVKRPGEAPVLEQISMMESMRLNGWTCLVVYSVADLKTFLDSL